MKFRDMMADVLLGRVAEKIPFSLVGPKDSAIVPHPVHANGCILKKIAKVRLALSGGLFRFLALCNFYLQGLNPLQRLICRGGEFAQGTHDSLILSVKLEALIMSDGPNRSYRFVSDVEWDEQYFDNWGGDGRRNRIIPFRV